MFTLQKLLGHSSIEIVKEYVNLFSDDLKVGFNVYNPLEKILRNQNSGKQISLKG